MENSSNINWTTLKQNVVNDIYKYYSKIESYKHSFWNNQERYSSTEYTDDIFISQMICNERYIFVLVKFDERMNVLFIIDTTLPIDSYKIYDKAYGDSIWHDADLDNINLNRTNEMKTISAFGNNFKLYCVQDSSDEQCVLISDEDVYLYKNGNIYKHEYSFTIKNRLVEVDKLVLYDEFDVQYTYTFTGDSPIIKTDEPKSNYNNYNYIKYDYYKNIRIDQKGIRYRITYIDKIPTYTMLPIYSDKIYNKCCISKNICAMETDWTSLTYLIINNIKFI